MCDTLPLSPAALAAGDRIDDAVDHVSVAEAAEQAPLDVLQVLAARCDALSVPDATIGEVLCS